jgi:hypothetical protein
MVPEHRTRWWIRIEPVGGICALIILGIAAYYPWVTGHFIIPYDAFDFAYPTMYFASHSLHHGEMPWWNPYVYAGYPQIADPQALTFSPLSTGLMALVNKPSPLFYDRIILGHLCLAGVGMFIFARQAGRSWPAALLAGLITMIGGCLAARLQHAQLLIAYGYIPWVGFTLVAFLRKPSLLRSILFGLALGLLGVHLLQDTYIALVLVVQTVLAFLIYRLIADRQNFWQLIGGLALAALVTLLICGWQVVATLSFLPETQRAALSIKASSDNSAPWSIFMTLLRPEYWHGDWGQYSGSLDRSEGTLYEGILAVPMLLVGVGHMVRTIRRENRALAKLAALLVILQTAFIIFYGLGLTTPIYTLYYEALPGISLFRRPVDAFFLLNLYIAFLVACGFDSLRPLIVQRRSYVLLGIAAVALLFPTLSSSPYLKLDVSDTRLWLVLLALILFGSGFLTLLQTQRMHVFGLALCLVLIADLRAHTLAGTSLNAGNPRYAELFPNGSPFSRKLKEALAIPGQPSARIEQDNVNYYWSNAPSVFKISSTEGYNPFFYSYYSAVFGVSQGRQSPRPFTPWAPSYTSPIFNLMGARYVISFPGASASKKFQASGFTPAISGDGMIAWHNPRALPRVLTPTISAFWTGTPQRDHALAQTVDFTKTLMLAPQDAKKVAGLCTGRVTHFAISNNRNDSSRYNVSASAGGGWLVVTDQATSGWHGYIDGREVPLFKGDLLVRAVCVPPGQHIVTFRFEPFRKMRSWIAHKFEQIAFAAKVADSDGMAR